MVPHKCGENSELFQGSKQSIVMTQNQEYTIKGGRKVGQ